MRFLAHRIADKRLLHIIGRTLKSGVDEDGRRERTVVGTPQGAVISPILGNTYLHYVLDLWARQWRNRSASGEATLVRYADDSVMGFQYRRDGQRFLAELKERLGKFGLSLIEFGRFAQSNRAQRGEGKP
jgi:RNA-directed DNA polymerase